MKAVFLLSTAIAIASATLRSYATCKPEYSTCGYMGEDDNECCDEFECHEFDDGFRQCLTPGNTTTTHGKHSRHYENGPSCKNFVSVRGDATYCLDDPVCSGYGSEPDGVSCPNYQEKPVAGCTGGMRSYLGEGRCVAPEDAECTKLETGAWGCVWASEV
ncbi:Aste57867_13857 [Aphanomyces stellatus]|uniref:Aste57867_13857 protein n=1 Tax=Aphanomyces stellatus TaxID=120398 RepID=A0A485KZW7_9STRA|nr:hypothetical protein As57867_013806 [Aphanomyces stellatus]VFT90688.1 Aste57867_13857 [Aphanomyces stellatus]